ncbi:MAG: YaiI/YqxD family protein [Pseudomonadales bacterium]|nr:YaiI/YqxD family protein [Pseudomonadales bacterium]
MTIWVDADACPKAIKEVLCKAANRVQLPLIFVANQYLHLPKSTWIQCRQVEQGFDVADDYIVQQVKAGDLVVTQDIPLAAELIAKGAVVINTRGEALDQQNIKQRLNMRDFMETMRASAVEMRGGPAPFSAKDKQQFANALDRYLAKR